MKNDSDQAIPSAFLIRVQNGKGSIKPVGRIFAHSSVILDASLLENTMDQSWDSYLADVSKNLEQALVASGLYPDEALAMVKTWSKSYFKTPGTRILYILPRAWTDQILPIQMNPSPDSLVRTLVGRVEILSQAEEMQLEQQLSSSVRPSGAEAPLANDWIAHLGRFAEPKLRRVVSLTHEKNAREAGRRILRSIE